LDCIEGIAQPFPSSPLARARRSRQKLSASNKKIFRPAENLLSQKTFQFKAQDTKLLLKTQVRFILSPLSFRILSLTMPPRYGGRGGKGQPLPPNPA
jgi:hypothetical protein